MEDLTMTCEAAPMAKSSLDRMAASMVRLFHDETRAYDNEASIPALIREACNIETLKVSCRLDSGKIEPSISLRGQGLNNYRENSTEDSFVNSSFKSPEKEALRRMNSSQYQIGIICTLPSEHLAACRMLDDEYGQPNSNHVAAGDDNTYRLGVLGDHKIVLAVPHGGEYGTMSAATVAANMCRSFPNIRFGLVVGDNGSAPMTNSDIRLGDVVVSYPGDTKGSWIQYDRGNRIHSQDFEPAARPGQDFLGGLLIAASTEQKSTVKAQLFAYTYRSEMEEQKGMRTASQLVRRQMELPILRPKDGAGVRILSLDGGGVRGCTELRILQRIERLAGLDDSRDPAIPWDNFCQITRRNTGGLISTILGHPSMTDQLLTHRKHFRPDVGHHGIGKLINKDRKVRQRSSRMITRAFDDVANVCTGEQGFDFPGSESYRVIPNCIPQDDTSPKNRIAWSASNYEACTNSRLKGDHGTGRTRFSISALSWWNTVRRAASRRQLHTMTDQLPIHEEKARFDPEHDADLGDKESQTGVTALYYAASKGHESLVFLLLSSTSAAVSTSWNDTNNKAAGRSGNRVIEAGIRRSRLPSMNPSLTEFVLAISAYSIAVVVYSQRHRGDHWQDQIILFALSTSTLMGLGLGYDLQTAVLDIVSWAVIAALILSSVGHSIARLASKSNVDQYNHEKELV